MPASAAAVLSIFPPDGRHGRPAGGPPTGRVPAGPIARVDRVIGIAAMHVSGDPDDRLVTYALGSCLGVAIYDPVVRVGGLLHLMLPDSQLDAAKARSNPCMFADTGIPLLFRTAYALGAQKQRIIVKVAGGAMSATSDSDDHFQIGKRNIVMLRKLLWKNGVLLTAEDVGGSQLSRTMSLTLSSGDVHLRVNGSTTLL